MRIRIKRLQVRLRAAVPTAFGTVRERPLLTLALQGDDGCVGVGEAAPLEAYDGVSIADARAALEDCRDVLVDADGSERIELLAACWELAVLPQAVAAVDLALWDLAGRRAGQPVWRLLGGKLAPAVEVNATIAASDRATAAVQASAARADGFGAVKVKVGVGDDAGRLAAVRAACGPRTAIRLDANGAWSEDEANAALRALEPVGIELCEEPVHGLEPLRRVAVATPVPVAIDESAALPGALEQRWCEAMCLKIGRCGGISALVDSAQRARSLGYQVYLSSTLDGPLGIAAALQAAAVVRPERPSGLATLDIFERRSDLLRATAGRLAVPPGPGLGDGLTNWYRR